MTARILKMVRETPGDETMESLSGAELAEFIAGRAIVAGTMFSDRAEELAAELATTDITFQTDEPELETGECGLMVVDAQFAQGSGLVNALLPEQRFVCFRVTAS